ncbi:hypothetical protein SAMD00019534_071200, partial [Acytostelium subglobosum LB1]|uniref:hypothetical protein n=1 Tax=Acytostelium subglobosum LB1 TaxID=1410327 RepID=UPI00064489E4
MDNIPYYAINNVFTLLLRGTDYNNNDTPNAKDNDDRERGALDVLCLGLTSKRLYSIMCTLCNNINQPRSAQMIVGESIEQHRQQYQQQQQQHHQEPLHPDIGQLLLAQNLHHQQLEQQQQHQQQWENGLPPVEQQDAPLDHVYDMLRRVKLQVQLQQRQQRQIQIQQQVLNQVLMQVKLQLKLELVYRLQPSQIVYLTKTAGAENEYVKHDSLPPNISALTFGPGYDQPIVPGTFGESPSFISLDCSLRYNQPIAPHSLPTSLTSLTMGEMFNLPLEPDTFPNSLITLKFGYYYNKPLQPSCLPLSLRTLRFGTMFNCPIMPTDLPQTLQSLELGFYFNHPLQPNALPDSLTWLKFGTMFNQPVDAILPMALKTLSMGPCFMYPLTLKRQIAITSLELTSTVHCSIKIESMPPTLQSLKLHPVSVETLPMSITELTLGEFFDGRFETLIGHCLPTSSVTSLKFGDVFNQEIPAGRLPTALKRLIFGNNFNQEIAQDSLPETLTELEFGLKFNKPLSNLPPSLCKLTLSTFNSMQPNTLPQSLKQLLVIQPFTVSVSDPDSPSHHPRYLIKSGESIVEPFSNSLDWFTFGVLVGNRSRQQVIKQMLVDYPNVTNFRANLYSANSLPPPTMLMNMVVYIRRTAPEFRGQSEHNRCRRAWCRVTGATGTSSNINHLPDNINFYSIDIPDDTNNNDTQSVTI